jgi:hypothetical protein
MGAQGGACVRGGVGDRQVWRGLERQVERPASEGGGQAWEQWGGRLAGSRLRSTTAASGGSFSLGCPSPWQSQRSPLGDSTALTSEVGTIESVPAIQLSVGLQLVC